MSAKGVSCADTEQKCRLPRVPKEWAGKHWSIAKPMFKSLCEWLILTLISWIVLRISENLRLYRSWAVSEIFGSNMLPLCPAPLPLFPKTLSFPLSVNAQWNKQNINLVRHYWRSKSGKNRFYDAYINNILKMNKTKKVKHITKNNLLASENILNIMKLIWYFLL